MNMQDYLSLLHKMAQENERHQPNTDRDTPHHPIKPDLTTDEEE